MILERVLDELELTLGIATKVVADSPPPAAQPQLAENVRDLICALYFELRRYRDALDGVIDGIPF